MIRLSKSVGVAAAVVSAVLWTVPVQAAVVRAWVSGHGNDVAGCGAPTNACRTLQYAHDSVVAAGGEIDILDPAGYGTLTITKAISIVNDGVGTAGVQAASGAAITINAGATDAIRFRGLNIEGLGTATTGILFNTGASLTIEDSTVKDFTSTQIDFQPSASSQLYVSNSRIERSGSVGEGVFISPQIGSATATVQATLEHVEAIHNALAGVDIVGSGGNPNVKLQVTIADSVLSDNASDGLLAVSSVHGAAEFVMVRNTTVSNNQTGIVSEGGATTVVAHSTLSGNVQALFFTSNGVIGSYGDNDIDGNGSVGTTPAVLSLR
jgi:Right handed beta helix region